MDLTPEQEQWLEGYRAHTAALNDIVLKRDLSPEAYARIEKEFDRDFENLRATEERQHQRTVAALVVRLLGQGLRRGLTLGGLGVATVAIALTLWLTSFSGITIPYVVPDDTLRGGPPVLTPTRVDELLGPAIQVSLSLSRSTITFRLTDGTKLSGTFAPAPQLNIPEEPLKRFFTVSASGQTAKRDRIQVSGTAILKTRDSVTPTAKLTLPDISWSSLSLQVTLGETPPQKIVREFVPVR